MKGSVRLNNFIQTESLTNIGVQLLNESYVDAIVYLHSDEKNDEGKTINKAGFYKVVRIAPVPPATDPTYIFKNADIGGTIKLKDTIGTTNQDYLYTAHAFTKPDWNDIDTFMTDKTLTGGCSGYVRNGKFCRSFDFQYNDTATIIIDNHSCGYKGIAGAIPEITKELVDTCGDSDYWDYLQWMLLDGINRSGIVVSTFMVAREGARTDQGNDKLRVSSNALTTYLLCNLHNIDDLSTVLDDICVYMPEKPEQFATEYHWLISNGAKTVCLEYVDNAYVITDITAEPIITNFYLNAFDGTRDSLNEHGQGFERYSIIKDGGNLKDVAYTHMYSNIPECDPSTPLPPETDLSEVWRTDFNGWWEDHTVEIKNTTADDDSSLLALYPVVRDAWATRTRDSKTWHTQHAVIYNFDKRSLKVCTQEDYDIWWLPKWCGSEPVVQIPNEEVEVTEGVYGTVLRHGNDIHFHFHYKALGTPINEIAHKMPRPFAGLIPEFAAATTTLDESFTVVATIDEDGSLTFRDDALVGEFTIDGAYFSRDFFEAKGYTIDNYAEIKPYTEHIMAAEVTGDVTHFGNLVSFTFEANGTTDPVITIAEGLPLPVTNVDNKFVVTLGAATTYAYLDQAGTLKFDDSDGFNSFVVNGFYYSKNYEDFMGLDISMEKGIKQLTAMPEPTEYREYQQIHYIGETDDNYTNNTIYICTRIPANDPADPDTFEWKEIVGQSIEVYDVYEEQHNQWLVDDWKGYRLYQYTNQGCPLFPSNKGIYWLTSKDEWSAKEDITCYGVPASSTVRQCESILCGDFSGLTQVELNEYIEKAIAKADEMGIESDISDSILFYSIDDITIDMNYGLSGVDPLYKTADAGWVRYVHQHSGPFSPYDIGNLTIDDIETDLALADQNKYSSFTPGKVIATSDDVELLNHIMNDDDRMSKLAIVEYTDMDINSDVVPIHKKGWYEVVELLDYTDPDYPKGKSFDPKQYHWVMVSEGGIRQVGVYEEPSIEHDLIQWIAADDDVHNMVKDHIYCCESVQQYDGTFALEWVDVVENDRVSLKSTIRTTNQVYLYEGDCFDEPDWDKAEKFLSNYSHSGSCSGFVRDGKFYRSFDFLYNDTASIIIDFHNAGFVGIAGAVPAITKEVVDSNIDNVWWDFLPYVVLDGINRHRIACASFMLHREGERTNQPVDPDKQRVAAAMMNAYILAHLKAMDELEDLVDSISVYMPEKPDQFATEYHWMISDGETTKILEYIDNVPVITDVSAEPIITNFYIDGFDGTRDTLNDHGQGFERYNIIKDGGELSDIAYTNMYAKVDTPSVWRTDYNEKFTTKDVINSTPDDDPDLLNIMDLAKAKWTVRTLGDGTWHSQHMVTYTFKDLSYKVSTHEDYITTWPATSDLEGDFIEQVTELDKAHIVPGADTVNMRVFCTKSALAKKYNPGWYLVGEDDLSPIDWDSVIKYPKYDNLPETSIAFQLTSKTKIEDALSGFFHNCVDAGLTEDKYLYIVPSVNASDFLPPECSDNIDIVKHRVYKYTYHYIDSTAEFGVVDSTSIFEDGMSTKVFGYPLSTTDVVECSFDGASLVIKNAMVGKYILISTNAYVRPAIRPAYYQVLESSTTPGTYFWYEVNDTWETDDIRKFDWMLNLDHEGYQIYQYRTITENEPGDPDYYFAPRATYVVYDNMGTYEWKQLVDNNVAIEFEDIDAEEVTNIFLREEMVGFRVYQTKNTYYPEDPVTGEKPVKRSKGWYEVVKVYPDFPDMSTWIYEWKVASGDRGYVTAVNWEIVDIGTGWQCVTHSVWENENQCFCRLLLKKINSSAGGTLVRNLPYAVTSETFLAHGREVADKAAWKEYNLQITQAGTLRWADEQTPIESAPTELSIDFWYVCEEKTLPLLVVAYGIGSAAMTNFANDLKTYAQTSPYIIEFHRKE